MRKIVLLLPLSLSLAGQLSPGQADQQPPGEYNPKVAPASKEGELALKRIRVPQGLRATLFAAEPLLANPVAFCADERGRFFVAETFRYSDGVTDNRGHMYWLDDDLAARTVADRVAMYRKHLKDKFKDCEREHDRLRLVVDTDGDGVADRATVFADGFHRAEDGIGSGVLARKGHVYYTCIPDLWLLKDADGDGKAEVKQSLSTGYGVHVAFIGHDLHGLRMGPDGKLYFSVGDRGLNVNTKEGKHLFYPDTGAVLRCHPDGSNLEVVATGLRNPQELAFDDFGNLFTVDNNSDAGDKARLVHVVEGGDSGWRMGYQYGSSVGSRGPWSAEKLWHLAHEGQPAYILPPLAHFTAGPSGLCYYPGVGLGEKFARSFFVCDFHGDAGTSGVWSFRARPKGATFELADPAPFVKSVLATDCDFGPDGAFYVLDWTQGWDKPGKGRIYKVGDPEEMKKPVVAEVKKLLAEGFDGRPAGELVALLGHAHQQVRLEAQFALAAQGDAAVAPLVEVAAKGKDRLARLHALWGLGQVGPVKDEVVDTLLALLKETDSEVRAQAAKVLGGVLAPPQRGGVEMAKVLEAVGALTKLLADDEPRVRLLAALGLSRLGGHYFVDKFGDMQVRAGVVAAARAMVRDKGCDATLRHAAVLVLAAFGPEASPLAGAALPEPTPAERVAAVLAYRRQTNRAVGEPLARLLADPEPRVVAEAARAVHDVPVPKALPALAALAEKPNLPAAVLYRALNAHFRLGKEENAVAVARFAARADAPAPLRVDALKMLGEWSKPGRRDRVTGLTQDLGERPVGFAAGAIRPVLGGIFSGPDRVCQEAARVASRLGIKEVGPVLAAMLSDAARPAGVRVEALRALDSLRDARLEKAVEVALKDREPALRHEGRRVLARLKPETALDLLEQVLADGDVLPGPVAPGEQARADRVARQGGFAILGGLKGEKAERLLAAWLDNLRADQVPAEVRLDLLEAARASSSSEVKAKLARYEAARPKGDPLAAWREVLVGGDAEAGRRIFFDKSEASCLRCHKVSGTGGDVGPDLAGIGGKQTREYLLEALVDPNRQVAKGFETVVLTTTKGTVVTGVVKAEDKEAVRVMTAEGKLVVVLRKDIEDRQAGRSSMPDDLLKNLTRHELRDLVEYLAGLK